jgi:hypothetical protein
MVLTPIFIQNNLKLIKMLNNQDNKNISTDSGEINFNSKIKAKPQLNLDKKLLKDLKKKKLSQALRNNLNRRKKD